MRYELEKSRFEKLYPGRSILKTADLIAEGLWFSWVHCRRRVKELPKEGRRFAWRLLRAAQFVRSQPPDADRAQLYAIVDRTTDPLRFFVAPLSPAVYAGRFQPIIDEEGGRIGFTKRTERMPGNKVRVYYSGQFTETLEFMSATAEMVPDKNPYFRSLGMKEAVTTYQVKRKKNLTP